MTSTQGLSGQVAVITGAGSGIGRATALALGAVGAECVLVGRHESTLQETASMLSTPASIVIADLTTAGAADRIVDAVVETRGRIDVLVHSAGVFDQSELPDTDREMWDQVIGLNLTAVMELTRRAWTALCGTRGQIVLISSVASVQAFPGDGAYAASKAGLNAFGDVIALEGKDAGIRVITVCPGQVDTPLWDGRAPDPVRSRMMRPEAVGDLIASLVTSDRGMDFSPVFVRPRVDPWQQP